MIVCKQYTLVPVIGISQVGNPKLHYLSHNETNITLKRNQSPGVLFVRYGKENLKVFTPREMTQTLFEELD